MALPEASFKITASDQTASAFRSVRAGLENMKRDAETAFKSLKIGGIGTAVTAATAGLTAAAVVIKNAAEEMAALDAAAQISGASVENLSGILHALQPSGASLEQITGLMEKLAVATTGADKEASKAAEAFKLLKIDPKQYHDQADLLQVVAAGFSKYRDGAEKTALAQAILTKSGAQYIPLLKNLSDAGAISATVTAEQAAAADEFEKELKKLSRAAADFKREIANEVIPILKELLKGFREAREAGLGLFPSIAQGITNAAGLAGNAARYRGELVDQLKQQRADLDKPSWVPDFVQNWRKSTLDANIAEQSKHGVVNKKLAGPKFETNLRSNALYDAEIADKPVAPRVSVDKPATGGADKKSDHQRLVEQFSREQAVLAATREGYDALTAAEKHLIEVESDLATGKIKLTKPQQAEIKAILDRSNALERAQRTQKAEREARLERNKEIQAEVDQTVAANQAMRAAQVDQEQRIAEIGKEAAAVLLLRDARKAANLEDQKAQLKTLETVGAPVDQVAAQRNKVDLLQTGKVADLQEGAALAEADNTARMREIEAYNLTTDALIKLKNARVDEQIAAANAALAKLDNVEATEKERAALEKLKGALESSKSINAVEVQIKRAADVAQEFGMTFKSAFEDAIVEGKKLGEVIQALEKDIIRMVTRKAVTEPLGNNISDWVKGAMKLGGKSSAPVDPAVAGWDYTGAVTSSGGGGFVEWIGAALAKLFAFEKGGVMSSAGTAPLRRFANGGIAGAEKVLQRINPMAMGVPLHRYALGGTEGGVAVRPTFAMFGEGSTPEAYVPLPDGRNIPVKMQGSVGGQATESYQFNFNGIRDEGHLRQSAGQAAAKVAAVVAQGRRNH